MEFDKLLTDRLFHSINGVDNDGKYTCLCQYVTISDGNGNWLMIVKQVNLEGFYISTCIEHLATIIYQREFKSLNVHPSKIDVLEWYPISEFTRGNLYKNGFAKVILNIEYEKQSFLARLFKVPCIFSRFSDVVAKVTVVDESLSRYFKSVPVFVD